MTGVDVTPISGVTWPQPRLSLDVSPLPSSETFHRNALVFPLTESASNAYTLSCSVATYKTFFAPTLGMATAERYNGCASTSPSTVNAPSLPKVADFTLAG